MLKKLVIAIMAALVCVCISGCGKAIEGSCSNVVSQCQDLKANESAKIVVSGKNREFMPAGKMTFVSDNGVAGEPYVCVYFDEETTLPGTRVTIEGDLMPSMTASDHITINHAKVTSK